MQSGDDALDETSPQVTPANPLASDSTQAADSAAPPPSGDDAVLAAGDAVARYRIESYLGRGGMGVVYRARDPDLDRALAIKLVRSRNRGGDRMLREAQAMARLDHPNVVPIEPLPVGDLSSAAEIAWLDNRRGAYIRADHKTFLSIDRENHQTAAVYDDHPGWTFGLSVDPAHGLQAVYWNREPQRGIYVTAPGGTPELVMPTSEANFGMEWTPDGSALWIWELAGPTIDRYTPSTRKTERMYTTSPGETGELAMVAPLPDARVLVQTRTANVDLVVLE